jgi:hypothetical protein
MIVSAIFTDTYDLGYMDLKIPENVKPVTVTGIETYRCRRNGQSKHLKDNQYLLEYNIDGSSWLYEGSLRLK